MLRFSCSSLLTLVLVMVGGSVAWSAIGKAQNASSTTAQSLLFRWSQFTADGTPEERSIYPDDVTSCPGGTTERPSLPWMTGDFSVRICSHQLAGELPNVKKIVVIGDTGCRVRLQDRCNERSWPLKIIANLAAQKRPDLVIHLGDYLYRECPDNNLLCADRSLGNRWSAWQEDFFEPAKTLLEAAPWIFVRGNHESCDRQAEGWVRLLSPKPGELTCGRPEPPYLLQFRNINFVIVDSSIAPFIGHFQSPDLTKTTSPTWMLSHRPFHALNAPLSDNTNIDFILSGHVHDFGAYTVAGPIGVEQFVVGTGGTKLDENPEGKFPVGATIVSSHGYLLITNQDDKWIATLYGLSGKNSTAEKVIASCTIQGPATRCITEQ